MWQAARSCLPICLGRPGSSVSKGVNAHPGADPGVTPARRELEAQENQGSSGPAVSGWLIFLGGIQAAALVMSARPAGRTQGGTNFICYNCGQGQICRGSERCPRCRAPLSWAGESRFVNLRVDTRRPRVTVRSRRESGGGGQTCSVSEFPETRRFAPGRSPGLIRGFTGPNWFRRGELTGKQRRRRGYRPFTVTHRQVPTTSITSLPWPSPRD